MQTLASAAASREAAQWEPWMWLLPNHNLAGEQGTKAHPLRSPPSPAVARHCVNPNGSQRPKEPRWCRQRRQLPQVQSRASRGRIYIGERRTLLHKWLSPNMVHVASSSESLQELVLKADSRALA